MKILGRFVIALVLLSLGTPAAVRAAVYPVNKCVGKKMQQAGVYCGASLKAWSKWDKNQDATKRDDAITKAAGKLDTIWLKAEDQAIKKAVDCADTTMTSSALTSMVDAAVGQIVNDINTGLDLGTKGDAVCGAGLLNAAAKRCQLLLGAEGVFIKTLAHDPDGARRNAKESQANALFEKLWGNQTNKGCTPTATQSGIEAEIDTLKSDVVTNTTISPNVSTSQFDVIAPPSGVSYEKRTLNPICSRGTPYYFFAKRGTVNKLLMYYQGGGACWDYFTCTVGGTGLFDNDVNLSSGSDNPNLATNHGFADLTNPNNPFKDWNIVFVPYCSGDVHWGSNDVTYHDPNSSAYVNIHHRGFINAKSAEKWAREHFVNPSQVFVSGSSAGAYGALMHGVWLHQVYPASDFAVMPDAGNGVITTDFLQNYFPNWGVDNNIPKYVPGLNVPFETLSIQQLTADVANYYPKTRWAHYATAFDGGTGGQTGFYNVMRNPGDVLEWLNWWDSSCAWNSEMRTQAQATYTAATSGNYRYYIGSGSRHTAWGYDKVYTDTTGGVPTLVSWVNQMLNNDPLWANVEASPENVLLPGDPAPSPLQEPFETSGPDTIVNTSSCP